MPDFAAIWRIAAWSLYLVAWLGSNLARSVMIGYRLFRVVCFGSFPAIEETKYAELYTASLYLIEM